jgi:hypothetical protein
MDDQGMTAEVGKYFDNMEQRFRHDAPAIGVHRVPSTIAAFIDDLFTDSSVTKPVGDLYIATHADGDGFMFVRLFRGQLNVRNKPTDVTDFEVLDQAMKPTRPGKIPDSLVGYVRATPPATDPLPTHSVHLKGCNIGRDRFLPGAGKPLAPFLVKWKEVFGGNVNVTAPKHFHGLLPETNHNGMFEYMEQELIVRTKAVKTPRGFRGFAKRKDLIDAYIAANLSYHDGTPIPDADWDKILVPKRMVADGGIATSIPLGKTIENLSSVPILKQLRIQREDVDWPITGAAGTPEADRLDTLRASIAADNRFKDTHPWPVYERRGFVDFDAYMDGHLWTFAVNGNDLACTGRRFDYTIVLPIVDRTVSPPAKRPLIFNFYPGVGSSEAAVLTGLLESDDHFFGRA